MLGIVYSAQQNAKNVNQMTSIFALNVTTTQRYMQ